MRKTRYVVVLLMATVTTAGAQAADDLRVLPAEIDGHPPAEMMKHWLLGQVGQAAATWKATYEGLKDEQITGYQERLRGKFVEAIGGFPERTPLNARVTGVIEREGYKVEKTIFESQPGLFVTALLFLPAPELFQPPVPGILVPCGHSGNGKEHDTYQTMGASLALHGMTALVFDPIDQGERCQLLNQEGKPVFGPTQGHTMAGVGCVLLGRNTARFEIWDGMRGIDYLQSRPEVDPKRIGCTGNSGGGTQTSYLMALDERIVAAAPSCYLTNFPRLLETAGPQDAEQNIFGQLAFGMDHPDYLIMRAPRPTLICAATKDFFDIGGTWETFRYAKRIYTRMAFAERVTLMENDAEHNYNQLQREAVLRWLARWLLGKDEPLTERPIKLLSAEEVRCTPRGQVALMERSRTVYELNEDYAKQLAAEHRSAPDRAKLMDRVREITGIRLEQLPKPRVEKVGSLQRENYRIEKLALRPEEGVYLPALLFEPQEPKSGEIVLYVHERGKAEDAGPGGPIESLVQAGKKVLAVDLRGTGETQQAGQKSLGPAFGLDWQDVFAAYLLGRSYVGMRAEDVLLCACYAAQRAAAEGPSSGGFAGVELVAVGNVGVPALHAAALEPALFKSVRLRGVLASWSGVIHSRLTHNQLINAVHGALKVYDLPDLAELLGPKLTIEEPVDAEGQRIKAE